jgi:pimeloyl-ACP methyl ester carboxylesterase
VRRIGVPATIDACARAVVALATALRVPVLVDAVARLTAPPRTEDTVSGGVEATLVSPGSGGGWPAVVVLNGATPLGRRHPGIVRLGQGLARAGFLVLVPDLPGVAKGEVTVEGVGAAVAAARDVAARPEARPGRVALFGISTGTTIGLLAAEEPELDGTLSVVAGTTGYTDLVDLIRLATTGEHSVGGTSRPYPAGPFLSLCVARSVAAGLELGPDRDVLLAELEALPIDDPEPLARLRSRRVDELGAEARATTELLQNRDPARYDELYARLPPRTRAAIERLSPVHGAARLRTRVELLFDPRDKYFPLEHAFALARAAPRVRVTVTEALAHADTRFSPQAAAEIAGLCGFAVRSLRAARIG